MNMANKKHINDGMSEETRLALLEQSIGHINETLRDIKNELKSQGDSLNSKMDSHFRWTIGLIFGLYATGFATLLAAVGKAYHWF